MKKKKLAEPREAGAFVLPRVAALVLLVIICFFFMAHDAPFEVAAMPQTVEQNRITKASDDILASKSDDEAHISGNVGGQHISGVPGEDQHISGVPGTPRRHEEQERYEERERHEGRERHEERERHEGRERHEDRDEHRELTVTFVEYLKFGEMTGDAGEGKAVISSQTGEMEIFGMTSLGGIYGRAELIIQGKPNKRFYVTLPGKVNLRNSNGVTSRLTDFTIYPSQTGVIDQDGFASIYVGATLTLSRRRDGNILGRSEGEVFIFVDYLED